MRQYIIKLQSLVSKKFPLLDADCNPNYSFCKMHETTYAYVH